MSAKVGSKLYCVCKSIDDGRFMFRCDVCGLWFHPECQGLASSSPKMLEFLPCNSCKSANRQHALQTIDSDGFVVIHKLFNISNNHFQDALKTARTISKKLYRPIFRKRGTKKKRFQFNIDERMQQSEWYKYMVDVILKQTQKLTGTSDRRAAEPSFLMSLPGCQRQPAHADYYPGDLDAYSVDVYPLGCLIALEDETLLDVWSGCFGTNVLYDQNRTGAYTSRLLTLLAGDVVFFRADLVHAGSSYLQPNLRMHIYLDTLDITHRANRTWRIDSQSYSIRNIVAE